jgi:hypothetical protein
MRPQHWQGWGRRASVAVVIGVTTACGGASVQQSIHPQTAALEELQRSAPGRRECPGEGVTLRVDSGGRSYTVVHVPLSDSITDIPEFHDCQRFIRRDSDGTLVFDSLFAVFASYRLDSLIPDLDSSGDTITLNDGVQVRTFPVATIFSDHRQYDQLGIRPGFNCLLLYRRPLPGTTQLVWGAMMTPLGFPDSNCTAAKPQQHGTPLQVYSSSTAGMAQSDYPDAARWDWDSVHSEHYVGIKCGAAWCQVGRIGFDTSASYSGPQLPFKQIGPAPLTDVERSRVTAIRGWYDEQRLAEFNGGMTRPSAMHGILVPNPRIHGLKATPDRYKATWVQVGFAVIFGGDYGKWNYRQRINEVLLCEGLATACRVDLNQPPVSPSNMPLSSCPSGWWATVRPSSLGPFPGERPKFFCLLETSHKVALDNLNSRHPGMVSSIPGTARWRWLLKDEGSWFGCLEASCCTKR